MVFLNLIFVGMLTITLGCTDGLRPEERQVDLNNDHIDDKVHYYKKVPFEMSVILSNGDGTFQEPKTVVDLDRFPYSYVFEDHDKDGDIDFIFEQLGSQIVRGTLVELYLVENDGRGNFSQPKRVASRVEMGSVF